MTDYRNNIEDIIRREFIGPDPQNGRTQANGEEILYTVSPLQQYAAGILFPKEIQAPAAEIDDSSEDDKAEQAVYEKIQSSIKDKDPTVFQQQDILVKRQSEPTEITEDPINLSNAYKQSAVSLTLKIDRGTVTMIISISAGKYIKVRSTDPKGNKRTCYERRKFLDEVLVESNQLPTRDSRVTHYPTKTPDLKVTITNRETSQPSTAGMYTISLLNENSQKDTDLNERCFFQICMKVASNSAFLPLPEAHLIETADQDSKSNALLYRNVKIYGAGHGCAARWDSISDNITELYTEFLPNHEVRPIIPASLPDVSFSMFEMSDLGDKDKSLVALKSLCTEYEAWINQTESYAIGLPEYEQFRSTIDLHINECKKCLVRMEKGLRILQSDKTVYQAFAYMNHSMLLQQLHSNLPLRKWDISGIVPQLEMADMPLPEITNKNTWYNAEDKVYGQWRPFQIAFVLLNIADIYDPHLEDRKTIDLIWFPTGGGKTEAYLGLSAFIIFLRRLRTPQNAGTTILMRYTLRLLTTQQYERASSLICACEELRRLHTSELGEERITIGLWVGTTLTPNRMKNAVDTFRKLSSNRTQSNPFVILKCPWCGAQMGVVRSSKKSMPIGYKISKKNGKDEVIYQCQNPQCTYSKRPLPLAVVDEKIYDMPPTLLIGTVDKFAMLPFTPAARSLFGYRKVDSVDPPELIIQDELHLISGPLGSMVGHYEVLIHELCGKTENGERIYPKIIASTATISRAKEQCNALYGVPPKDVFQFPPHGINADDSFFAVEDKRTESFGRRYVGLSAPGLSAASTVIRLYATLLYAAKELPAAAEEDRDPYWTNLGYFNSLRELGQAATWVNADISEYLHGMYLRRNRDSDPEYRAKRRYIYRYEELTSRVSNEDIPSSMQRLSIPYIPPYGEKDYDKRPVDICLATNMISVGVDIPRLALMTVDGQPKTTSEYIQATSRVGRGKGPGLVITIYHPGKPRDKSHYEQFQAYHSKLYYNVEPTSVTPFSPPVRKRALHGVLVGFARLLGSPENAMNPQIVPKGEFRAKIEKAYLDRVRAIDPDELDNTKIQLDAAFQEWENKTPLSYDSFSCGDNLPLIYASGLSAKPAWIDYSWPAPTSMRNVDSTCSVKVLSQYTNAFVDDEVDKDDS